MERSTEGLTPEAKRGCLFQIIFHLLVGLLWVFTHLHQFKTILTSISWPYYISLILSVILTWILLAIQKRPAIIKIIKMIVVLCIGIVSFMTVFEIGQGYIEFIPDGLPWVGNLDEAAAGALFLKCLQYFAIDLTTLFDKE